MIEAIVLAGGLGTRLRKVVPDLPKAMAPVCGRPFLELTLENLARNNIRRVVLALGYMATAIRSHFGNRFSGMEISYAVEDKPLDTGGAARNALDKCLEDHVLVMNGDTYVDPGISMLEAHWLTYRHPIIVGVDVPDTSRYGRLQTAHGLVTDISKKGIGGPGLVSAGCYVFTREQLDAYPLNVRFSLEADYFPAALSRQAFRLFSTKGLFIDIGEPYDYARAQILLARL